MANSGHNLSFAVLLNADLLTGADLNTDDEDDDSDLSHEDDSAGEDELGQDHVDDLMDDDDGMGDDADEAAAGDDVATAKGNHERRDDKGLLPTEDKYVLICSLQPDSVSWCLPVFWCLVSACCDDHDEMDMMCCPMKHLGPRISCWSALQPAFCNARCVMLRSSTCVLLCTRHEPHFSGR